MCGLREGLAHQCGAAADTVEAGVVDHLDDRCDAASFIADAQRERVLEFDLARGIGTVAELVLEPLDADRIARAVGQHPVQEEARQPLRRLG